MAAGHAVAIAFWYNAVLSISVHAATISVTSVADTIAVDSAVTLREAITSIDNAADVNADVIAVGPYGGNDTIAFNIPGAGVQTIALAALPAVTQPVTIDGYSQPGASPNTNGPAQGSNAVILIELNISAGSLFIAGGGSTVRGLAVNGVTGTIALSNLGGNTIAGNFIGTNAAGTAATPHNGYNVQDIVVTATSPGNMIGGTTPAARNLISGTSDPSFQNAGIFLGSSGNVVQGNLIGTNAAGTAALPNDVGIAVFLGGADNNVIGGPADTERNVISGNRLTGIEIDTAGNQVLGNFIGTDVTGSMALANGNFGVAVGGTNNVIGASDSGAGNVVSGNVSVGIAIAVGATGNAVQGNFVGTDATGTSAVGGHSLAGIEVSGGNNLIGGAPAGSANLVAFNAGDGVRVDGGTGTGILGNSIFANAGLGIELGSSGVPYANDPNDGDTGANNLQNYPVVAAAPAGPGSVTISATLNSTSGTVFRLEFFSNTACGRFSHGEGETFLGFADIATDVNGNAIFGPQVFAVPAGQSVITATATDPLNNTSEFSQCALADDTIFADGFDS